MKSKALKKYIKTQYNRDKRWCIDYHNAGVIEIYNMIFGRLQSLAGIDSEFNLGLGLREDMLKNVPWNRKMLGGYINNKAEFTGEDVENLNKSV